MEQQFSLYRQLLEKSKDMTRRRQEFDAELNKLYKAEDEKLKKQHQRVLSRVDEQRIPGVQKLEAENRILLKEMKQRHADELDALRLKHAGELLELEKDLRSKEQILEADLSKRRYEMGLKLNSTIEAMQEKRRLEKNIRELKRSIEDDALKRQVLAAFEQETETLQNSSPASATAVAHDAVQSIEAVQDLMAGADRTPRRALRRPHAVKQAPVPEDETEVGSIKSRIFVEYGEVDYEGKVLVARI